MMECSCEHVVRCYGSELGKGAVWIVMEYCSRGSVLDLLRQYRLSEADIATVLKAVLLGLDYLHSGKKIHRDVKAANILLDDRGVAKLADFGVAGELVTTCGDRDTFIGSPFWMSPEILAKSRYNSKTDIWSLGITAIEMAEGQAPYTGMHPFRAMFAIQKNPPRGLSKPELHSPEFNRFVRRCLTFSA
jgi:serine/threonine kinase 4